MDICEQLNNHMRTTIKAATAEAADGGGIKTGTLLGRSVDLADEATDTITMGIGLHQTSALKVVGNPLVRKSTINLKGKKGGNAKRRSASYAQSFQSIAPSAETPHVAADGDDGDALPDDLDMLDDVREYSPAFSVFFSLSRIFPCLLKMNYFQRVFFWVTNRRRRKSALLTKFGVGAPFLRHLQNK